MTMQRSVPTCDFCAQNNQCIGQRCPFAPVNRRKPKVAFICVHNSCRSQIAEALGHALAGDAFESYSAGTALKAAINPDAVRLMKQLYSIDMEKSQRPKLLADIPAVDVVITMGCGVTCPNLPCKRREDWGLEDPTGKPDDAFIAVIRAIEARVLALRAELARP